MTVQPLPSTPAFTSDEADAPPSAASGATADAAPSFASAVQTAFARAAGALEAADAAEKAFASGRGGLQEVMLERAQADVALSIAGAAASRAAQSLSTILGMQV